MSPATAIGDCRRCESPLERGDLRCAICSETVPSAEGPDAHHERVEILRCRGCGAAMGYEIEAQAPRCGFCDAVLEVETVEDPVEQTEHYLAFRVSPDEARRSLKAWFGRQGFFRVQDLRQRAQVEELTPLWWVAWVFDADATISWSADSNQDSRRSAWAPHAGQTPMTFRRLLVSASRGLTNAEADVLAESYDLGARQPSPEGPPGAVVERFDVQRSQARQKVAEAIQLIAASEVTQRHVPGTRVRNLHVAALVRGLSTERFAFPAYVMAYRYESKLYRVVISGHQASVLTGEAPLHWLRVLGAIVALILVLALIAAAVAAAA